jgi:dipeptidase E
VKNIAIKQLDKGYIIMRKMMIIGGGELVDNETFEIDKRIVELAGKERPRALFIPTASGEPQAYCDTFHRVFGDKLDCETDVLLLLDNKLSEADIKEKILSSDIIYVGGGNTSKMIAVWKEKKVDKYLKEAYHKGIILSGLSAGSICWFGYGQSEIESSGTVDGYDYIKIEGIGLLNAFHCPHYNEGRRKEEFIKMMEKSSEVGFAIDNNCAIEVIGDRYTIITSQEGNHAYKLYKRGHEVVSEQLNEGDSGDISELFGHVEL